LSTADDGNLVLSGSHDTTAVCWDIAKQEFKRTYRGHTGGCVCVAAA
jgi:WD40 repeat protein